MGIIRLAVGVLLACLLLFSSVLAGGFENTGVGFKARAMGGAFRAVADDWSAAYYNPAGYAFIKDNQLGANSAFLHLRNELTPNYKPGGIVDSTGIFTGRKMYNKHEVLSNPSGGFATRLPVWGEVVFGVSIYQPFDYNVTWTLFRPLPAYNDSLINDVPQDQYRNNLDVVAFQATVAREFIPDKLSIGIGLQVLRGDLIYKTMNLRPTPIPDTGNLSVLHTRPYDRIPEFVSNDLNGFGFGLKAGMLWKNGKNLNVAFTASLPFSITLKGDAELQYIMPLVEPLIGSGSPVWFSSGTVGNLFASGRSVVLKGDGKAKLKLPPSIGAGLAYHVTPKLLLALDAEYVLWSNFDGLEFTFSNLNGVTGAVANPMVSV